MNETKAVYGMCPTEDSRYFYGAWHSMNKLNGGQPFASSYAQSRTRPDENGQAAIRILVAAHDVTRQQDADVLDMRAMPGMGSHPEHVTGTPDLGKPEAAMNTYTMPFGKYRGRPLSDLPLSYIYWLRSLEVNVKEPLWSQLSEELERRDSKKRKRKRAAAAA